MSAIKPKILVIRGGAIGDFILTLPAIAALRKQFPQAHLEVLGYPHIAQVAVAGGLADRVQPIEARGLAGFFARAGTLEPDLMDYFSEFDLVISYLYDPDEIFKTNLRRCLFGQFIAGPHRPNEAEFIHATQVYLKPLEQLAIFDADPVPRLNVGQASSLSQTSSKILSNQDGDRRDACPTLALHPGSGSEKKNWPEARWAEFIAWLTGSTKLNLLLVGGEAEGGRLKRLVAAVPPARCQVLQNLPLPDLARRLQSCAAFVGHDSGISHLAAALGLPTLVLWADTLEEIWRPQGQRVVILRELTGVGAIRVEKVIQELRKLAGG
ncbi:MAG TPA: glycosyltransferase family 9 protein [Verrucomicrobiae bacterium]|nr:glycosyltransferase family 9 protein [Verrucomicrobiae bacterium]